MEYSNMLQELNEATLKLLVKTGKSAKRLLGSPQGISGDRNTKITSSIILKTVIDILTEVDPDFIFQSLLEKEQSITGGLGLFNKYREKGNQPFITGTTDYSYYTLYGFLGFPGNTLMEDKIINDLTVGKAFIKLIEEFKENGSISYDILKEKIEFLINFTEDTIRQFEHLSTWPDSRTLQKRKNEIKYNLNLWREGLHKILTSIEKKDCFPEDGLEDIKTAREKLLEELTFLREGSDIIYKTNCLQCSHGNYDKYHCERCSYQLPRFSRYIIPKPAFVSLNLNKIKKDDTNTKIKILTSNINLIINAMAVQKTDKNKFIEEVKKFENIFEKEKKDLEESYEKLGKHNYNVSEIYIKEILNIIKSAIENIKEGISLLKKDKTDNINLIMNGMNKIYLLQITGEESEYLLLKKFSPKLK